MPPPPEPPVTPSFQTDSVRSRFVRSPPHEIALSFELGKSACGLPSLCSRSDDPESPAATKTVTLFAAASSRAALIASRYCCVEESSEPPQLIEMIEGL